MKPFPHILIRKYPEDPDIWDWVIVCGGQVVAQSEMGWHKVRECTIAAAVVAEILKLPMETESSP